MNDVLDAYVDVAMPAISPEMSEGRLVRWFVREGQVVEPGDLLAEVAFKTATAEIEAKTHGRIARLFYGPGSDGIKVHEAIARVQSHEWIAVESVAAVSDPPENPAPSEARSLAPQRREAVPHWLDAALAGPVASLTYREALRDALSDAMSADSRVIVMGADVAQNRGAQRVTQGLLDSFGERRVVTLRPFDDAAFSMALGVALLGFKPVVEVASWGGAFEAMTAALDRASVLEALSGVRVPLVVRGPYGWVCGASGLEAQAVASRLMHVPGLKVVVPSGPAQAKALLTAALQDGGPVALLEAEDLYGAEGPVPHACSGARLGTAHVARPGRDLTLVSYGRLVRRALAVAERLQAEGLSIEVIDLMTVRPLDSLAIKASLASTRRLLIVEDGPRHFGVGAEIIAELAADATVKLDAGPVVLAGFDGVVPYSSAFEASIYPGDDRIASAARGLAA